VDFTESVADLHNTLNGQNQTGSDGVAVFNGWPSWRRWPYWRLVLFT